MAAQTPIIHITTVLSLIDYSVLTQQYFDLTFLKLNGEIRQGIFLKYTKQAQANQVTSSSKKRRPFYSIKDNRVILIKEKSASHPIAVKIDLIMQYNGYEVSHGRLQV